jgi:hypothetical protein
MVGALILTVTSAWAQQDKFKVYGFADVNFSRWGEVADTSYSAFIATGEAPRFALGNVNLYFDMKPTDKTRALVEVNLNKTGALSSDSEIYLERAWLDVNYNSLLNVKVGKFITPAGIWNVVHGSPIITTVRQRNLTTLFPFLGVSQVGLMVYGNKYIGDHEINYAAYTTQGRHDPHGLAGGARDPVDAEKISDLGFGGHVGFVAEEVIDVLNVGASFYTGVLRQGNMSMSQSQSNPLDPGTLRLEVTRGEDYSAREVVYGVDLKHLIWVLPFSLNLIQELLKMNYIQMVRLLMLSMMDQTP